MLCLSPFDLPFVWSWCQNFFGGKHFFGKLFWKAKMTNTWNFRWPSPVEGKLDPSGKPERLESRIVDTRLIVKWKDEDAFFLKVFDVAVMNTMLDVDVNPKILGDNDRFECRMVGTGCDYNQIMRIECSDRGIWIEIQTFRIMHKAKLKKWMIGAEDVEKFREHKRKLSKDVEEIMRKRSKDKA